MESLFVILVLASILSLNGAVEKRETQCYAEFGCFHSDGVRKVAQDPSIVDTYLRLYRRGHSSQVSEIGGTSWQTEMPVFAQHVDPHKQTKILIHGFLDNGHSTWILHAKDELLKRGDFNVIIVDWGSGSKLPYEQAAGNTFLVGVEVSMYIKYLKDHAHVNYADVHIIGHSLGAQIAGLAGMAVSKVGRISGLDPADPLFSGKPISRRLDSTDAEFVDVIHSDSSDFLLVQGFGTKELVGDIDFFPNGGEHQPGCAERPVHGALSNLFHGNIGQVAHTVSCSHSRAVEYFTESINSQCKFYAHACSSLSNFDAGRCLGCADEGCPIMGYDADLTSQRGSFYLSTSTKSKFCGQEYYVEVTISHGMKHSYGELFITLQGSNGQSEELKFSRHMQYYNADTVERHIIVTHTNIGDITGVKVRFVGGTGIHSYGSSHVIFIKSVLVEPTESTSRRVKFCGHDAHIRENHVAALHSKSGC